MVNWNYCRVRWKLILTCLVLVFFLDFMGVFTHIFEKSYDNTFAYPYVGDVKHYVKQLRNGETPDVKPINVYPYKFITNVDEKCKGGANLRLVVLVKSAAAHFQRRQVIRNTWGHEKRFSDVEIRTVFILGVVDDTDVLLSLIHEREIYQDIVHVDFIDSYYNNTIKTMSAMRWAVELCPNASYYFFSDDDMYVSMKNVLRFVRDPVDYPKNLNGPIATSKFIYDSDLPRDVVLYAGYVFNSSPLRHKTSKWYVTLEEYPYDTWPPYVTAGSYILSREALHLIYYTSLYTKHFRFDDVFLGLVAKKAEIEPFHSESFQYYYKEYVAKEYKYVIAVHGYPRPVILTKVWNEQKAAGNA